MQAFLSGFLPAVIMFVGILILLVSTMGLLFTTKAPRTAQLEPQCAVRDRDSHHSSDLAVLRLSRLESKSRFESMSILESKSSTKGSLSVTTESVWLNRFVFYIAAPVLNAGIILTVNGIYVYLLLTTNQIVVLWYLTFLIFFKICWNTIVIPKFIAYIINKFGMFSSAEWRETGSGLGVHISMLAFNQILAPLLATAAADSDCFQSYFVSGSEISVSYSYLACFTSSIATGNCQLFYPVSVTTTFLPPFNYSYQCSSALLQNYTPVFVAYYLFAGFATPLVTLLIAYNSSQHSGRTISLSRPSDGTRGRGDVFDEVTIFDMFGYLYSCLPGALRLNRFSTPGTESSNVSVSSQRGASLLSELDDRRILNSHKIVANLVTHFCVLLTFGCSYPPLAAVVAMSLVSNTFLWEIIVGRFLKLCNEVPPLVRNEMLGILEENCHGISTVVVSSAHIIMAVVIMFFSLFLFDMAGATASTLSQGLWIPLALVLIPVALWTGLVIFHSATYCVRLLNAWYRSVSIKATQQPLLEPIEKPTAIRTSMEGMSVDNSPQFGYRDSDCSHSGHSMSSTRINSDFSHTNSSMNQML